MHITPPGVDISDKYYAGFFNNEEMVAVLDLIDGYPEPDIGYIGFFMMNAALQGKQIGSGIIRDVCAFLKQHGKTAVRLGITYLFVRDRIRHSWDAQDKRVTVSASDVLREGVGICWAKANLLAALLRANGIPAGFSYQRLTLGDTPDTGYCIHVMNTVYMSSLNKWIRLDARGNKEGINAEFSLNDEKLAFHTTSEGEVDYHDNHSYPDKRLMKVLEESTDALDMYLHHLPDRLSYSVEYKIATRDDMEQLMSSRLEMLKVVNKLDNSYVYSDEMIGNSRYYFENGDYTTVLAIDGKRVIGCASICYISIMPTFSHPTGKRAHLMNVYTMEEWQRRGIARKMVTMLIEDAWSRGVTEITLDATEEGRPLYNKLGFTDSRECMVLNK